MLARAFPFADGIQSPDRLAGPFGRHKSEPKHAFAICTMRVQRALPTQRNALPAQLLLLTEPNCTESTKRFLGGRLSVA